MRKYWIFAAILSLGTAAEAEHYGAELSLQNPVSVDQAIQQAGSTKEVQLIEGKVTSVCQVKGCWMGFKSHANDVRVKFKDYGFFVPLSLVGKTVLVEGTLQKVVLSLERSKHYVEDGGGDPATVLAPVVEYQIEAVGVKVKSSMEKS